MSDFSVNSYLLYRAIDLVSTPDEVWLTAVEGEDGISFTKAVVQTLMSTPESITSLRCHVSQLRNLNDQAIEAELLRAWTFMKEVYGEAIARNFVIKAGASAIIGAVSALDLARNNPEQSSLSTISFPATIFSNSLRYYVSYSGVKGEELAVKMLEDLPLTTGDKESVTEVAKT